MNAMAEIDLACPNDREASDQYAKIVATLSDRLRVIECRDAIQWIVQRRRNRMDDRAWEGQAYCATRKALLRVIHGTHPNLEASASQTLATLPASLRS